MATPRKRKPKAPRRVVTVDTPEYNQLEMYCIWLNEYYNALMRAGFKSDVAMGLIVDKTSYPDWVNFKIPNEEEIKNFMDEEDED
jgi:hypothetical protein